MQHSRRPLNFCVTKAYPVRDEPKTTVERFRPKRSWALSVERGTAISLDCAFADQPIACQVVRLCVSMADSPSPKNGNDV